MNTDRIFRVLNTFCLLCGWQIHWFDAKARQFRVTILSIISFVLFLFWYIISFNHHFEEPTILNLLKEFSPVGYNLIKAHLLMGIKIMIVICHDMRSIAKSCSEALRIFQTPTEEEKKFCRNEFIIYILIFSTFLVNMSVGFYDIYHLRKLHLPLHQIMLFMALYIPHMCLSSSVKCLNAIAWTIKLEMQKLCNDLDVMFVRDQYCNFSSVISIENTNVNQLELTTSRINSDNFVKSLTPILCQIESLLGLVKDLSFNLQKQLYFLIGINSLSLMASTYALFNYYLYWENLLSGPFSYVFIASFGSVFFYISWDYFCLCTVNQYFQIEKENLLGKVNEILKRRSCYTKDTRILLKDIRTAITSEHFNFKIFWICNINWKTFGMVNTSSSFAVTIFVMYHYFDDRIRSILQVIEADD